MSAWENRKKVRGWKRRVRAAEHFADRHQHLDLDDLRQAGRRYVKLWIDPWYRLVERTPPVWYRRVLLGSLLRIHAGWERTLRASGEPFYLAIWLFHPRFIRSQVVAAVGPQIDYYATGATFTPDPDGPPEPPALYRAGGLDLSRFSWTPALDVAWLSPTFEDDEEVERHMAAHHRYLGERVVDRRPWRLYRTGRVWIGR